MRYHQQVIALRAPLCLDLGIVTALTAGLLLIAPSTAPRVAKCTRASAPALSVTPPEEPLEIRSQTRTCDLDGVGEIVIRGQFTSHRAKDSFAITFGRYSAFTDPRGYFEVRIPRDEYAGDLCQLPSRWDFRDDQMTLEYHLALE